MPRSSLLTLDRHVARWRSCRACDLAEVRRRVVFFRGDVPADVLLVGEAPGKSEDVLGEPFVGPAGHLLDEIVAAALDGFLVPAASPFEDDRPARVAFANLVACVPKDDVGGKLEPTKRQVAACRPRLDEFVDLCRPRWVVRVGTISARQLGGRAAEVPSCSIDHPAFVLRRPPFERSGLVDRAVVTIRQFLEGGI